jgi:diguanylate cyclase (GGDEF)-like protein
VAALLVVAGCSGTVIAAGVQSRDSASQARQLFKSQSVEVAANLELAIQHEEDLVASTSAFIAGNPGASSAEFTQWASAERALERYPEVLGLGTAVIVPASRLGAFASAGKRDLPGSGATGRPFSVIPPGRRPFYCLTVGAAARGGNSIPAGLDYCDGPLARPILAARDSGVSAYLPIKVGTATGLSAFNPVYRGGVIPATPAARRQSFVGWVGLTVAPGFLLHHALAGHPGTSVTFRYSAGASNVAFRSGPVTGGSQSSAIDLHNGWTVRTFATAPASGLFNHGRPVALLVAGIIVSLLLGALVFVLGTGRARARRLVSLKTSELRFQALHDGLTGLPNRTLISDRVEQLLSRSQRHGTAGAVLFVDLDEFKRVNDTLGHEAGDQLLQAVATRLTSGLRGVDTVGRLGGDEFIVLIDGESGVHPELVAERLLALVQQPFELDCSPSPICVSASIGGAIGSSGTGSELLRHADVALYQAKAAGKNRYEVFRAESETETSSRARLGLTLRPALADDHIRLA